LEPWAGVDKPHYRGGEHRQNVHFSHPPNLALIHTVRLASLVAVANWPTKYGGTVLHELEYGTLAPFGSRTAKATERKHLPLKDVAAAGGLRDVETLLECYQQPDADTLRAVMEGGRALHEPRAPRNGSAPTPLNAVSCTLPPDHTAAGLARLTRGAVTVGCDF
jgi:hypothetical protein